MRCDWECEFRDLILKYFLIPSLEDQFGDSEVIIIDDNASCHRSRRVKIFISESNVRKMEWTACNQYIYILSKIYVISQNQTQKLKDIMQKARRP